MGSFFVLSYIKFMQLKDFQSSFPITFTWIISCPMITSIFNGTTGQTILSNLIMNFVYFNQHVGAAHPNDWGK